MRNLLRIAIVVFAFVAFHAPAVTRFVDLNCPNPTPPYTNWETAATSIQDASAISLYGDTVLVTNGVYQYGGDSYNGSNRVDVSSGVVVQSVNGPTVTIIQGQQVPGTTNGPSAVRCAYIRQSGGLLGFTLRGGGTATAGIGAVLQGGGIYAEPQCSVSNCIISGNASVGNGGGALVQGAALTNCIIAGNIAFNTGLGGGVAGGLGAILVNCIISNNIAGTGGGVDNCIVFSSLLVGNYGGAAYSGALNNCTVTGNHAPSLGAAQGCKLQNCIVYYNFTGSYADCYQCPMTNCCTTIGLGTGSTLPNNSFTNAPGFANPAAGDYHLNPWSRCIDAGNSAQATNSVDLDGNPRIVGAAVDVGAYETQSPFQGVAHYVSLHSTNPVPPYTTWSTAATNLQDGVGAAQPGEYVIADDGVYANRGSVMFGAETNRVVLTNGVTLTSAGGPQAAIIVGTNQTRCAYVGSNSILVGFTLSNGRGNPSGDGTNEQSGAGVWCEMGGTISNCVIVGNSSPAFAWGGGVYGGSVYDSMIYSNNAYYGGGAYRSTLYHCTVATNVATYGGGAYWCTSHGCTLFKNQGTTSGGGTYLSTNYNSTFLRNFAGSGGAVYGGACTGCMFTNNISLYNGGAAYQTELTNCALVGNGATNASLGPVYGLGGGAYEGDVLNCLVISNRAGYYGGGVYQAEVFNCTIVGNSAEFGGGTYDCDVYNSIVYYNSASSPNLASSNYLAGGLANLYYCCTAPAGYYSWYCFTNEPLLVNRAAGDLHLQPNSPCINSGMPSNSHLGPAYYFQLTTDFDGKPRIIGSAVDVGAYEFLSPASAVSYAWLYFYGFPTDGSADAADADGDGMSNYAEWRANTIPTDSSSVLSAQPPVVTETNATITWQSVGGVTYFVQSTPDLFAQPFQSIASNIVGSADTTSYTDTNATAGVSLFYRVGVQ